MSTAAVAPADAAPPVKKGKKKLIMIIAIAVLLLGGGGAGAMLLLKKKPHDADADGDHAEQSEHSATPSASAGVIKPEPRPAPVFVPLDPFTVNLADRDAERYAQVGITLEIDDAKTGELIKTYMPAIRNHFLLALADSNAADLLARNGKLRLAEKLRREAARALGYTVPEMAPEPEADEADAEGGDAPKKKAKKPKKKVKELELPIRAVHFSNFIIQ